MADYIETPDKKQFLADHGIESNWEDLAAILAESHDTFPVIEITNPHHIALMVPNSVMELDYTRRGFATHDSRPYRLFRVQRKIMKGSH